jgi:hypothetical protein
MQPLKYWSFLTPTYPWFEGHGTGAGDVVRIFDALRAVVSESELKSRRPEQLPALLQDVLNAAGLPGRVSCKVIVVETPGKFSGRQGYVLYVSDPDFETARAFSAIVGGDGRIFARIFTPGSRATTNFYGPVDQAITGHSTGHYHPPKS